MRRKKIMRKGKRDAGKKKGYREEKKVIEKEKSEGKNPEAPSTLSPIESAYIYIRAGALL